MEHRGPRVHTTTFVRCIVHTARRAGCVELLVCRRPAFRASTSFLQEQLRSILPKDADVGPLHMHKHPAPASSAPSRDDAVGIAVVTAKRSKWMHPVSRALRNQPPTLQMDAIVRTFQATAPPPPEPHEASLAAFFQATHWPTDTLVRPFLVRWEATQPAQRQALLRVLLGTWSVGTPPTTMLIVAPTEAEVKAWALSLQTIAVPWASAAHDTRISIVTARAFLAMAQRGDEAALRVDVLIVEGAEVLLRAAHSESRATRVAAALRCARGAFLVLQDPLLPAPSSLPPLLRCLGENIAATSTGEWFWRDARIAHPAAWPMRPLVDVFRQNIAIHAPRMDWARMVQLGTVTHVTRQQVSIFFSVAQTWEYLVASGCGPVTLSPPSSTTDLMAPLTCGTAAATDEALRDRCNATDRHAREHRKWSWLSQRLKQHAAVLPLVVCTADARGGMALLQQTFRTSRTHAALRVRFLDTAASTTLQTATDHVQAFNKGQVDVLCMHPSWAPRIHLRRARTLVFWEPCSSAHAERTVLAACQPATPQPFRIMYLVTRFPTSQLREVRSHAMPQTDQWLQRQARALWPRLLEPVSELPTHWPRSVLWQAVRDHSTHDEVVLRRVQQEAASWLPVVTAVTAQRIPIAAPGGSAARATDASARAWTTASEAAARPHRAVVPVDASRQRTLAPQSHDGSHVANLKTLVAKLKRATAGIWRPWCPSSTTMSVWSRRITPIVTAFVADSTRAGWTSAQLLDGTALHEALAAGARALGISDAQAPTVGAAAAASPAVPPPPPQQVQHRASSSRSRSRGGNDSDSDSDDGRSQRKRPRR